MCLWFLCATTGYCSKEEGERDGGREKERENSNSKTLFYKERERELELENVILQGDRDTHTQ